MNDDILFYGSLVGLALLVVAWLWLARVAWGQRRAWGLAVLILPPAGLLFALFHWPAARRPFLLGLVGLMAAATPPVLNRLLPVDLGPRDTLVEGERHLTLTGWDRGDYRGVLRQRGDTVVLQMANPDVTDDILALVAELKQLRELDLSGTQVTDAGLALLADLPRLERLRLANTPVTDAGFQAHLAPHPGLRELDLRDTQVTKETIAAWRSAQPGRRALR
jgi:Leucine-rich repeat (LRR) protein